MKITTLPQLAKELKNCGSSYWRIENAIRYSKLEDWEKRYLKRELLKNLETKEEKV